MNRNFAAIILGGTGQVGGSAVAELMAVPECREVVMVTRKPLAPRSRISKATGLFLMSSETCRSMRSSPQQGGREELQETLLTFERSA